MKYLLSVILFTLLSGYLFSQTIPTKRELVRHYGFEQSEISRKNERIVYYTHQKDTTKKTKLVMYLQGSDPSPLFSYSFDKGELKSYCFLKSDFLSLSEEYLFVAIEKVGFEGSIDENNIPNPEIYQEKNSLSNRVFRAAEVIKYLDSIHDFSKIIVYGHSEGAPVAAKLATENDRITHLGFWAGNALPDFFDFTLEVRREYYKGNISAEKSQKQIEAIIDGYVNHISKDSLNTDAKEGYTNLRWWSYSEPPINYLTKVEIPIFVQVATEDVNAPIESSYLIPLEFARLGKSNLTYNVCVGCDHSFSIVKKKGKVENKWNKIFVDFLKWTERDS